MINYADVWITVILLVVILVIAILGFLYELAGETVDGWHTISFSAHRHMVVRIAILGTEAVLGIGLFILLYIHFNSTHIAR